MKPELMAPAGDWATLTAAVKAGADAVYFGAKELNMRATAKNFEIEELPKIVDFCHENNARAYLTVNTIIYEDELQDAAKLLLKAKAAKIDAVICWDFSVIELCRKLGLPFFISTQASVSNSKSAEFYKSLGAGRVVLARECSLEQIREIRKSTDLDLEIFIHGAMCVSVSGRCFTSQFLYGRSANRGVCIQPCRRKYRIIDDEENTELVLDNNFVMSAKDLWTMPFFEKLMELEIDSLKIEGRTKGADYIRETVACYRKAIDAYLEGSFDNKLKERLMNRLKAVYNRGFSTGFYLDKPGNNDFAEQYGAVSTKVKLTLGKVLNFYKNVNVAEVLVQDNSVKVGDEICVIGPTTGCVMQKVESMEIEGKAVEMVEKGKRVGIKLNEKVRENDRVYLIKKNESVLH